MKRFRRTALAVATLFGVGAPATAHADPITIFAVVYAAIGSTTLAFAAAWVAANITMIAMVGSFLYGAYSRRKAKADARAAFNKSLRDRTAMIRSATEPRQILIGRDKLSGPLVYVTTSGTNKEYLHMVIAMGGHAFDAIETIFFGDVGLPAADANGMIQGGQFYKNGKLKDQVFTSNSKTVSVVLPRTPVSITSVSAAQEAPGGVGREAYRSSAIIPPTGYTLSGNTLTITSGVAAYHTVNFRYSDGGEPIVRIRKYLGTQTTADAELVAESDGEWTSAHVGYGVPYLYVRLKYDNDVFGQTGIPNVAAVCRGAVLYDPRRNMNACCDFTGGTPGTPGVWPDHVGTSNYDTSHGLQRALVGTGTDKETGFPYMDVRLFGTVNTTGSMQITLPFQADGAAAIKGQNWSGRVQLRTVGGAWTFQGTSQFQLFAMTASSSTSIETNAVLTPMQTAGVATKTFSINTTLSTNNTIGVHSRLRFNYLAGATYDCTLRIILPELFQGAANGSNDPRYWNENSALATAWWLRHQQIGGQAQWNEVPTDELIAEANVCDEAVPLVSGSQPRYTSNGTLYTEGALRDNLEALLSGMAGMACWVQGRWLIRAGAYEVPEMTIDDSFLAQGDIDIVPHTMRRDLYNTVSGVYTDAASGYIERQMPVVSNATYVLADGGKKLAKDDMPLPMIREAVRAQRMAKIDLETVRQCMTVSLTCNLKAYKALPGRMVYLTLPRYKIIDKPMLVTERIYVPAERRIRLSMVEVAPSTYAWNYGNATTVDTAPNSGLPVYAPLPIAPTGLVVVPYTLRSGTINSIVPYAKLTWTASTQASVLYGGRALVQHKRDDAAEWIDAGFLLGDSTTTSVGPLDATAASVVRVAFVDDRGRVSDWCLGSSESQGALGSGLNIAIPLRSPSAKSWGGTASAKITVKIDGTILSTGDPTVGYWNPTGGTPGNALYIRATKTGGAATPSGTYNSWLLCNVDRIWTLASSSGSRESTVLFEFANTSGGAVVANFTAWFTADATNDTGGGGIYLEP